VEENGPNGVMRGRRSRALFEEAHRPPKGERRSSKENQSNEWFEYSMFLFNQWNSGNSHKNFIPELFKINLLSIFDAKMKKFIAKKG
jgi:hypothetical protein